MPLVVELDRIKEAVKGLDVIQDIEAGFVTSKATGIFGEDEIYPAKIELSIDGDVMIDT